MTNPKKLLATLIRSRLLETSVHLAANAPTEHLLEEIAELARTGREWLVEPVCAADLGGGAC